MNFDFVALGTDLLCDLPGIARLVAIRIIWKHEGIALEGLIRPAARVERDQ